MSEILIGEKLLGGVLSLLNLLVWGCWPYARKECNADTSKIITLLYVGEVSVVAVGLTLSDILYGTNSFYDLGNSLFFAENPNKVLLIFLGGFNIIWADFLVLCAFNYIPVVIALPVVVGVMMGLGSTFDYIVQEDSGTFNVGGKYSNYQASIMTILAVTSCIIGVVFLGGAHYFRDLVTIGNSEYLSPQSRNGMRKWFVVCLFAGVLGASWNPLVNYGGIGIDGVTNPFARLLVYLLGQGVGLIYILNIYASSWYEKLGMRVPLVPDTENEILSMMTLLDLTWSLPKRDIWFGLLTGGLLGIGYLFNFAASRLISPPIVFAIAGCEPLATILIGLFVPRYKEFVMKDAPMFNKVAVYICLLFAVLCLLTDILLSFEQSS